jgi:hypothetical protein
VLVFTLAASMADMSEALFEIFQKIGFAVVVISWLFSGVDKRVDSFELFKKLVNAFMVVSLIYYFPRIIDSGMMLFENIAESFKQDHEVLSKTIQLAVLQENGGWFPDFFGGFMAICIDLGSLLGHGISQIIYLFGNAMSVLIILVSPTMLAFLLNENFKSLGLGFLKYSAIIMMIPLGIMMFDFFHLAALKWCTQIANTGFENEISGPQLILNILNNPESLYDKGALEGKQFGATYLFSMGILTGGFGLATIASPWLVYKLFGSGDVSGMASQVGGAAQSAAAPAVAPALNMVNKATQKGPSVKNTALLGLRGAQAGGRVVRKASNRLLGRSSPQSASTRKPKI